MLRAALLIASLLAADVTVAAAQTPNPHPGHHRERHPASLDYQHGGFASMTTHGQDEEGALHLAGPAFDDVR